MLHQLMSLVVAVFSDSGGARARASAARYAGGAWCAAVFTLSAPPLPLARASGAMRTTLDDSQDDAGTLSQGDLDFLVSLQYEGIETDPPGTGYGITVRNVDDHTSEPGSLAPLFLAHTRECNGETALRVTTSAPSGEGSAGSVGTMINTSFGPRSGGTGGHTNPSVLCGRSEIDRFPRAHVSSRPFSPCGEKQTFWI